MSERVLIRRADFIVGYREEEGHVYLKGADLAFSGDTLEFVGHGYTGQADRVIDGRGYLVIPGLISTHSHLQTASQGKGFLEDEGSHPFYMSGLFEYLPALKADRPEWWPTFFAHSLIELLRSGCTTVLDMSPYSDEVIRLIGESGIRAYLSHSFRSGEWYTPDGHDLKYRWYENDGLDLLEEAVEFVQAHDGEYGGRLRCLLTPLQVDTSSPRLLERARHEAGRLGVKMQIHASQSVPEFMEMIRRTGMTPIQYLHSLDLLGPDLTIGHCIFVAEHSWINYRGFRDLPVLAETGTSVAHCPWVFFRRGMLLESLPRYRNLGINVALGTDTYPLDMMEEMRWAALGAKIVERDTTTGTAAQAFEAATLGGARALGREDLGRLAPGARADLVMVDLTRLPMRPVRDPLKSLIYTATSRPVDTVIVAGQTVVREGRVLTVDWDRYDRQLQPLSERLWSQVPERDWAGRGADELSPLSLPVIEEKGTS